MADHRITVRRLRRGRYLEVPAWQLPAKIETYGSLAATGSQVVNKHQINSLEIGADRRLVFFFQNGSEVQINRPLYLAELKDGQLPSEITVLMSSSFKVRIEERDGELYIHNDGANLQVSGVSNAVRGESQAPKRAPKVESIPGDQGIVVPPVVSCGHRPRFTPSYCQEHSPKR